MQKSVAIFMVRLAMKRASAAKPLVTFAGLTAFEAQQIRAVAYKIAGDDDLPANQANAIALFWALNTYLNFIQLFFNILRILGRRR